MASNLVKKVMLKIVADDGDSETKLDRITEKADELGRKHPELTPKVNIAAASARLAVLKRELKDTADAANKDTGQNFMSRLSGLAPSIGQMGLFQKVMLGVNAATTFAEPLIAGVTVAAGGLASGLTAAGAGVGVFGLVAKSVYGQASTAATAYAAAQEKVALASTKAQRTAGLQAEKAALYGLSPPVRGLTVELGNMHTMWQRFVNAAAPGVVGVMSQGIGILTSHFGILKGFLPPVETALSHIEAEIGHGLNSSGFQSFLHTLQANAGPDLEKVSGIIGHIVEGLGGILKAFMPVSSTIMGGLDNWTAKFAHWGQTLGQHSGFQSMMTMFRTETPIAMHVLGNLGGIIKTVISDMTGLDGVGNSKTLLEIAQPFTGLLNTLLKLNPDLVRVGLYLLAGASAGKKISAVFGSNGLAGDIQKVTGAVKGFRSGFSDAEKAADESTGVWGTVGGHLSQLKAGFNDAEQAAAESTGMWGTVGGKISSALSGAGSMVTSFLQKIGLMKVATEEETVAQDGLDASMDANPIGLIVVAIGLLVVAFVELWKHSEAFRAFWKAVWKDIQTVAVAAWHFIDDGLIHPLEHGVGDVVSWVTGHWKILATVLGTALLGPIGGLVIFIATHWSEVKALTGRLISDVVGFFERLPGQIMSFVGRLPGMLYNAGRNAIMGLIHGIESMAGDVGSAVSGIASKVAGFFGLSPAREGPLAGGGAPFIRGQHFAQDLAGGMRQASPSTAAAAAHLAGLMTGASGGARAGGGAAAGGLTVEINVPPGGAMLGPAFWTALGKGIRVKGGDPQILQRKVKFA